MKFHVTNIEPAGYRFAYFLDNVARMLVYGLESLGHDCSLGQNNVEPDCTNIIVGGHLLTRPEDVEKILSSGASYIVCQSEIIRSDGVNLLRNKEKMELVYMPLLHGATAVWDGSPENLQPLARRGIQASQFLGGYHPSFEEVTRKNKRDIDFLFVGSPTPHRRDLMQQLRDRGYRVTSLFDARAMYRNDAIARTKVHLAPGQGDTMDHFPWSRVCFLLNNRGLVVVERCRDQEWLEHCFVTTDAGNWCDACIETLQRQDRLEFEEQCYQRFRQMPFTDRLAGLLEETNTVKLAMNA